MKAFLIALILLASVSAFAAARKPAQDHKFLVVRDAMSSFEIFVIDLANDCDDTFRKATLKNGMTKYPFTYKCAYSPAITVIEIKQEEQIVASFSMPKLSTFSLTIPFKKSYLTIQTN